MAGLSEGPDPRIGWQSFSTAGLVRPGGVDGPRISGLARRQAAAQRAVRFPPPPQTMTLGSLHLIDLLIVAAYLVVVTWLGHRAAAKGGGNEEGFFLAGRSLGKLYQFFLNFGNATDANGAVSTASLVYKQGASGVWHALQTLFMNPYYWFMNLWFRRVRLVTVADLFEDRFGSRALARFYALFQIFATVTVIIGFGNLISYKVTSSLLIKPESRWTPEDRRSAEGYREYRTLETARLAGTLAESARARHAQLADQNKRGELRSYISWLHGDAGRWGYYLIYTLVVGAYIVMGGLAATALNEAFQGVLIVVFSVILIPFGLSAIGGWGALAEKVPAHMLEIIVGNPAPGTLQVTVWTLLAILFVSVVQIHGIIGNMTVSGSARDEFAARFGAVSGTYAKRIMIILWAVCGLIAIALFAGPQALSDPDAAWGAMTLTLLPPGALGLMMAGLLAANMSTVAAQTMAVSALFTRNLYKPFKPAAADADLVRAGRWAIVGILSVGVIAAANMEDVFTQIQLLLTVQVPFGAAVMLMFFWRRVTAAAVWTTVIVSTLLNLVAPRFAGNIEAWRTSQALVVQGDEAGVKTPVFWDSVVLQRPGDLASPLEGRGRFHVELYVLHRAGLDVARMDVSTRYAARFFFSGLFPFVVLFAVSPFTRRPAPEVVDRFYGKMKTPVDPDPARDAAAMAETRRDPHRFDDRKLFPRSAWEFTKWDRVDTIGFFACCAVSGAIFGLFALLLRAAG
jgi:Na+/proline symporter